MHRGGQRVHGVIPDALAPREIAGDDRVGVEEVVPDMHTRKKRMADMSDGFIALPGGYGTLEELMEVVCWSQIGWQRGVRAVSLTAFLTSLSPSLRRPRRSRSGFCAGYHSKPVGLLNVSGYYNPLLAMVDHAIEEGFIAPRYRALIVDAAEPAALLDKLERHEPPAGVVLWKKIEL